MFNSNAANIYKNNSVNLASKEQLLLMLLDGAIKYGKIAREALINKDTKKSHESLVRIQDIFYELIITLDQSRAGEWGKNMVSIYKFIIDKAAEANIKKDVKKLDEIMPLIEDVRNMWNEAYKISKSQG